MLRRQILYGITLILIGIIIFLFLRERNAEKEREAHNFRPVEIAMEPSSPVRAILPRDLEIVDAAVSWIRNPDEKDASVAHHDITIRNAGGGLYVSLWLRIEYVDERGRPVENRTHEVNEALPSEGTLRVSDITINGLPDAASDFHVAILSADLESSKN